MTKDIAPELLEAIQRDFSEMLFNSKKIARLNDLISNNKATYKEVNEYALELGEILAKAFSNHLSSDVLPGGKMYYNIAKRIIDPTMSNNHDMVVEVASNVQASLNQKARIGIKGIKPEVNQNKIDGIIERVSDEPYFDDIAWILQEPVVNFTQSVVDTVIRENADFQEKAGLKPRIIRRTSGKCCEWCDKLAGIYDYADVKDTGSDVFRRHRNCKCSIEYDPGDGRRQDAWSKRWMG